MNPLLKAAGITALTQREHEAINAREYPGTRQLCIVCCGPTGRCEEDSIFDSLGDGPLCPECWRIHPEYKKEDV